MEFAKLDIWSNELHSLGVIHDISGQSRIAGSAFDVCMLRDLLNPSIFVDIVGRIPQSGWVEARFRVISPSVRRSKESQVPMIRCVQGFGLVPPLVNIATLRPVARPKLVAVFVCFIAKLEKEKLLGWNLLQSLADLAVEVFKIAGRIVCQVQPENILRTADPFEPIPETWAN